MKLASMAERRQSYAKIVQARAMKLASMAECRQFYAKIVQSPRSTKDLAIICLFGNATPGPAPPLTGPALPLTGLALTVTDAENAVCLTL